jgi:hypothetical protein
MTVDQPKTRDVDDQAGAAILVDARQHLGGQLVCQLIRELPLEWNEQERPQLDDWNALIPTSIKLRPLSAQAAVSLTIARRTSSRSSLKR